MKKLLLALASMPLLVSCGVKQSDYDKLKADYDTLIAEKEHKELLDKGFKVCVDYIENQSYPKPQDVYENYYVRGTYEIVSYTDVVIVYKIFLVRHFTYRSFNASAYECYYDVRKDKVVSYDYTD